MLYVIKNKEREECIVEEQLTENEVITFLSTTDYYLFLSAKDYKLHSKFILWKFEDYFNLKKFFTLDKRLYYDESSIIPTQLFIDNVDLFLSIKKRFKYDGMYDLVTTYLKDNKYG
jgi:hypothetical protein